jgi:nicotinate-nucleotide pyrophosphorylase (carboxylating)
MDIIFNSATERLLRDALDEDIGIGDVTTMSTIPAGVVGRGLVRSKQACIVAGLVVIPKLLEFVDPTAKARMIVKDGDAVEAGTVVCETEGPMRALLMAERTLLNFIQRLSGTATLARRCVEAVKGSPCKIIDTRKTTPGLRQLEKYAVRLGGAMNHRYGLYDAGLIKDNHITACGSIIEAVARVRRNAPFMTPIEVECENLDQVKEALAAGADFIMLDNASIETMEEAVRLIDGKARVEASGGITLDKLPRVAGTGVDFISLGALTHSAPSMDFNMKVEPVKPDHTT